MFKTFTSFLSLQNKFALKQLSFPYQSQATNAYFKITDGH